jgi:hypothetical protein
MILKDRFTIEGKGNAIFRNVRNDSPNVTV